MSVTDKTSLFSLPHNCVAGNEFNNSTRVNKVEVVKTENLFAINDNAIQPLRQTIEMHAFKDAQAELVKGIEVTNAMRECIVSRMPSIINRTACEGVHIISDGNALVFEIPEYPQLVFIFRGIEKRFDALVQAKHVCMTHQLESLIIPHALKFEIEFEGTQYLMLAEEKLDIQANEFYQENLYCTHIDKLIPIIRQLATFIAKTEFSDVNWRNIPLLNTSLRNTLQVALFDVDETEGAWTGFFGRKGYLGTKRLGLIGCAFTEEQIDLVLEEAAKLGVKDCWGCKLSMDEKQQYKAKRLKEIALIFDLSQFYLTRGIITGHEPLQVDIAKLKLDLNVTREWYTDDDNSMITLTLRNALEEIIRYINDSIQKSEEPTIKGRRQVNIITGPSMRSFRQKVPVYVTPFSNHDEEKTWVKKVEGFNAYGTDSWVNRVITSLIESKYLFNVITEHGCGILIQA